MHTATSWRFELELLVYSSDRTSVFSHFAANKTDSFAYVWPDGSSAGYTVRYVEEPWDTPQGDGTWWTMRVVLEGPAS
jgi:hypothetical protein